MEFIKKISYFSNKILELFGITILDLEKISSFFVLRRYQTRKSYFSFGLITGCPRSGTTLVQAILSTHSKVKTIPDEIDFSSFKRLSLLLRRYGWNKKEKLDEFFKKYSKRKYLILKRPTAIFYLNILEKFFPNIKIIIMERNYADLIYSLMNSHHFRWTFDFALSQVKRCKKISEKYKNKQNCLIISYEEIVTKPEKINKILKFLGLPLMKKKDILNFYKRIPPTYKFPVKNATQPISKNNIGKGKANLSKKQLEIIKRELNRI